jgi:hypothetical protein
MVGLIFGVEGRGVAVWFVVGAWEEPVFGLRK